jgi:hypothetical protein
MPTLSPPLHTLPQVLRNFISNALKFTPENGRVMVRCCFVPNDDEHDDHARVNAPAAGAPRKGLETGFSHCVRQVIFGRARSSPIKAAGGASHEHGSDVSERKPMFGGLGRMPSFRPKKRPRPGPAGCPPGAHARSKDADQSSLRSLASAMLPPGTLKGFLRIRYVRLPDVVDHCLPLTSRPHTRTLGAA